MLTGSVAGGYIAQVTSLGVPFVLRGIVLAIMFVVAFAVMRDVGFTPERGKGIVTEMRSIASASIDYGWRVPAVKWLMVSSIPLGAVGIYAFYALQPYLLELKGDPEAYGIAGLTAAIVAGAQIVGGFAAPRIRGLFHRRTSALIAATGVSAVALAGMGFFKSFWVVVGLVVVWGLLFAASEPIRQTYINGMIPSRQRASILSFDSLMASGGGVVSQPALGKAADVWGYPSTYLMSAGITALALPFIARSRAQNDPADVAEGLMEAPGTGEPSPTLATPETEEELAARTKT